MHACVQVHRWVQMCEYVCIQRVCVCVCLCVSTHVHTYTEAQGSHWEATLMVVWLSILSMEASSLN